MLLSEAKELIEHTNNDIHIYHYFTSVSDVKSILQHGLLSAEELKTSEHLKKYIGRDGINDPNEYFKQTYDKYYKQLVGKDYSTYGIFFTSVNLFTFDNKFTGRIKIRLSTLINKYDVVYEDEINSKPILVKTSNDLKHVIKLSKNYQDPNKVKSLYWDKNKTYLFENLPHIVVFAKNLKITKSQIQYR